MTEGNKKQYTADVRVMNYLLQAIPNDIYNSVDACKNDKDMWEQIKRLMFGSDVTSHVRHSRLMDEFDKFAVKEVLRHEIDWNEMITENIIYMFHDTIKLPVETIDNPFVIPATIEIIESFMHMVGYQGLVDKLMKQFLSISPRLEEDYHSIKDDIPLVSVYTAGNVIVQGILISNAFLTKEIRATNEYKEYETVFVGNGNTKEKKYIPSLHKIHAARFPEADLKEKMSHWVRKEFKNFNEDARLSIQH
ncbi:hypothetical protein Tco_0991198 [Tanacetum coccineum]|uniref:Uncharacterized protein n=1 Tax=Tanacetum coccineum TaxID=301880 RepID=A0ABQ5EYY6_9ASTR